MDFNKGIIDQIYFDEKIIIISVLDGTKSISVSFSDCDEGLMIGDFVLYNGFKWIIAPNNLELKNNLKNQIKSLYNDINKI
ncbi:MAG: hypothetical protein IJX78_03350 [Bacilli bacterium]|nr:hypothetical protein [Bacilli bacterium]